MSSSTLLFLHTVFSCDKTVWFTAAKELKHELLNNISFPVLRNLKTQQMHSSELADQT